ncbi:UvrD-helicase domain-containing protein [Aureispira sp. CCB-E]|uniref:UvrD-helicase domain-containing protein n=1 Tax=Aureispira sp. CCB-E TaxID=3051121 RepID=UPI002868E01B|nr:UvrD-helicase domain-containing protein [Aureispira sp. CCB-E]WMX16510.1 AAA family ATPase [Aureispira sp. CCB-E]
MKLLFYSKFFDSLIKLPKGVQRDVIKFQKKFRENSKSLGIHLEPISIFKDSSLRSARIDKIYRAIIKAPKSGDTYYLLWVDHHDKAYDWAKNKIFQWNENTESMQVFISPDEEKILPKVEATESKEKGLYRELEDKDLIRIGVPEILLPSVRKIMTLDDLEQIENYIPEDVFENLFYLADGAKIDSLISEIEEGKSNSESEDDQLKSINNQRNFIELTDDTLFNEILSGTLDKWKYYLHPSQRKLVSRDFSGTVKVTGGAGTGKTVVAIHRLKYLASKMNFGKKILFTTYTKALATNLTDLVKGFGIDTKDIVITNIDALVLQLAKEYKVFEEEIKVFEYSKIISAEEVWDKILESELVAYDKEFLMKEYRDIIIYHNVVSEKDYLRTSRVGRGKPLSRRQRKETWVLFEKYRSLNAKSNYLHKEEVMNRVSDYFNEKEIRPFAYCLVDELQDFSNVELRLIRSLVEEKSNDLFFVGDPLQKIYDKRINFSKVGINVRGKRSRRLRINYRTTEEIKKLAVSIIKDCHYDNFDGEEEEKAGYVSLFHGKKPMYTIFKSKNLEIDHVLNVINQILEIEVEDSEGQKRYKYKPSDIAVSARTKSGIKDFINAFHQNAIPYAVWEKGQRKGDEDGVNVMTFHNIKGFEFKHVFLVDVNNRSCPKRPFDFDLYTPQEQESYLRNEKSTLYVAVSRAVEHVEITGIGTKSEIVNV